MSGWVLVPKVLTRDMVAAGFDPESYSESWLAILSARPPIPADVMEQMVERGARAIHENEHPFIVFGEDQEAADLCRFQARACILAALGESPKRKDPPQG